MDEPKVRLAALAGAAMLLALVACNPFSEPSAGDPMTVAPEGSGSVIVRRAGNEIEVTGRFSLNEGDIVRTTAVPALVRLEVDRSVEVAPEGNVRIDSGASIELLEGSVLASSGAPLNVVFDDVTASTDAGTIRVDRGTSSAVTASFTGVTEVAAPGQEVVELRPLFQASVAAREVLRPEPYEIDVADEWDRSELTDVVELNEQLKRYAGAMKGQLGTVNTAYFETIADAGEARAIGPYVEDSVYSSPDLLIAFSIAELDDERSFKDSLGTAFRLNRAGGEWGVVATIMRVPARPLFAALEDAILASGAVAARPGSSSAPSGDGGVGPGEPPGAPGGNDEVTRGTAAGGSNGSGSPGDGGGQPPGNDGGGSEPPEEEECANLIDCLIEGLSLLP